MNITNIKKIMENKIWKNITNNKFYRGYIIIDQHRKPNNQREKGQFFLIVIFFELGINAATLSRYKKVANSLCLNEGLGSYSQEFYVIKSLVLC